MIFKPILLLVYNHRAELTALERGKLVEEWRELTSEKGGKVASPPGGVQPHDAGVKKTAHELGVDPQDIRRASKIASLSPEAQAAAVSFFIRPVIHAAPCSRLF